ncbi:single-stranded DNA-binding protein (plasmid) [Deinococcus aetherius]|uniref:Single-stranded DNA-binding protein n=1 Tax=Deinococcus aetherius TaxID=200252 RepID=A0ABM8ALS5_9DEIO|nr:single-stranded DNA-binding protein [Deinococcus aetherius]BDP44797.1 single-stranded DNA-binding protein [Deinococcus aetherius]
MNKVLIIAALARDPELRYTPGGTAVLDLTLAGERHITGSDGRAHVIPFYENGQALGKYAEHLAERGYQAGDVLVADGQLDYSQWEAPEGGKRSALRVRVTGTVRQADGDFEIAQDGRGGQRLRGGLNRATVIGNVSADPELRYTPAGDAVLGLRLGVNEKYKDRQGQAQEKTHWVDVTLWRDLALAHQGLRKGDPVLVEGALVDESWTDRDGNRRRTKKVEADSVVPLSRGAGTGTSGTPAPAREQRQPVAASGTRAASSQNAAPAPTRSGGLDIDQGLEDFPPDEEPLPF